MYAHNLKTLLGDEPAAALQERPRARLVVRHTLGDEPAAALQERRRARLVVRHTCSCGRGLGRARGAAGRVFDLSERCAAWRRLRCFAPLESEIPGVRFQILHLKSLLSG